MDTPSILYLGFLATAAAIALAERVYALRNERRLLAEGAEEVAPWVFRLMTPVYTLVFLAAAAEHLFGARCPPRGWVAAMAVLFVLSKGLKLWVVLHLRDAWTMKVILPRALRVVASGPYRRLRHPNYVAVVGEILAVPLLGGAWATAIAGSLVFVAILACRVRTEEAALMRRPEYAAVMGSRRRFLPAVLLLAVASGAGATAARGEAATLAIDPARSTLEFTVSRPGEAIEGKAPSFSGEVALDPARPAEGSSVALRVLAAHMATGNGMRDRKMRSAHLDTDSFPEITFRSTVITLENPGESPAAGLRPAETRRAWVEGTLALHGAKRAIRFPAAIQYDDGTFTAEGGLTLKLTDYAIPIPRFLWIVLDDEVKVRFKFVAALPASSAPQPPSGDPGR
jgi:methyltransferase